MISILFVIKTISSNQLKLIDVRNKRFFPDCLLHLWNWKLVFNIWKKTWTSYRSFFRNYRLLITPLLKCLKCQGILMTRFGCQHLKGFQTLLKSAPQYFYTMCSSLLSYFSYKKFLFVIFEILRPFFNLLILDDKYSLGNRENLLQPIQMQLSKKRQIFSRFFTAFLKCRFDFEHFAKKRWPW